MNTDVAAPCSGVFVVRPAAATCSLTAAGVRRVPGPRKEELAVLAGMSSDYYSRLEQGRQANVSASVLDALARALRLNEVERKHLLALADPSSRSCVASPALQQADPGLLRLMTALDPVVGELSFDIETVTSPRAVDQVLVTYTVQSDSRTARKPPFLASWELQRASSS